MTTTKHWTYNQITQSCERRIRAFVALARQARTEGNTSVAQLFSHRAEAAYETWHDIVAGWAQGDDAIRLRDLSRSARDTYE